MWIDGINGLASLDFSSLTGGLSKCAELIADQFSETTLALNTDFYKQLGDFSNFNTNGVNYCPAMR